MDEILSTIVWIITFISLFITFVWINFLYLSFQEKKKIPKQNRLEPSVSIAIPAHNEQDCIYSTIKSVANLEYPKDKLEIIVINDASTDNTQKEINRAIADFTECSIKVIKRKKSTGTKAAGMNQALKIAKGDLFGCVDADSVVDKKALKYMIHRFGHKKTGAVISAIQVHNPKNMYEYTQRLEYMIGVLTRKLMSSINALVMTPGVLSLYKKDVLKGVGGFDTKNITEDYEIALRLKSAGYTIEIEPKAATYTKVPNNFKMLWSQRIRWFRGFIHNSIKYRHMIFNKKYGVYGCFQLPFNLISIPLLLLSVMAIGVQTINYFLDLLIRSLNIKGYFWTTMFSVTTPKQYILSQNFMLILPIFLASVLGFYLLFVAHKLLKERFKAPVSVWVYFVLYPFITACHWSAAIGHEIFRTQRKW